MNRPAYHLTRRFRRVLLGLTAGLTLLAVAAPVSAQSTDSSTDAGSGTGTGVTPGPVDVLQVNGLFDAIVVDSITQAIGRAHGNGSQALILQVDSRGAVVSDAAMAELLDTIAAAPTGSARLVPGCTAHPPRSSPSPT
jgi:membrane-bound serine protease (ClpP class)